MSEVELTCMSDIEMKPIEWLWDGRIACGKITVIAGNPGLGKSQLTAWLASIVSQGLRWPDTYSKAPQGEVIFLSAEDDVADTIKPRLLAADANINLCHVLQAVNIQAADGSISKRGLDLSQDIKRLSNAIGSRQGNVKLVIIDPISAYLGKVDSNKNAEIRGLLMQLSTVAEEHGVAIVMITHNSKDDKKNPLDRVIGSIGMVAAARAAYTVIKDMKNPELRYFLPLKNNIGNDYNGFSFEIKGVILPEGISTSCIYFHEGLVDAKKILNPEPEEKPTATNGAIQFLRELLTNKPMMANEVYAQAKGAGYGKATIQRAATKLGVIRKKQSMGGGWLWSVPKIDVYGQAPKVSKNSKIALIYESYLHEDSGTTTEGMTPNNMQSSTPS